MKSKLFALTTTLFASALLAFADPQVGQPAPDFEGKDMNGQTHKLSEYKGKIVVLEANNLDCPFCHNQFQSGAMPELQKDVTSKGGVWLVVTSMNPKSPAYRDSARAKADAEKYHMNATAWIDDHDGKIGRLYGMKTTPDMFVIDPKGTLVYAGAIDDRPSPDEDPRTARNYVRDAVNAVRDGKPVAVAQTKSYGCGIKY